MHLSVGRSAVSSSVSDSVEPKEICDPWDLWLSVARGRHAAFEREVECTALCDYGWIIGGYTSTKVVDGAGGALMVDGWAAGIHLGI